MNRSTSGVVGKRKLGGRLWPVLIGLTLLMVSLALAGCGAGTTSGQSSEPSERASGEDSAENSGENGEKSSGGKLERPALGEADAPVVMTEYSDFQ